MKLISVALTITLLASITAAGANDLTPAQQEEVRIKSGEWMEMTQKAEALNKQHKFAEAEGLYKKMLDERVALNLDTSAQHNTLAKFYANWGKNDLAEEQYVLELKDAEKMAGLDESMYIFPLEEHAKFLEKIGKKDEAAKLRARVKTIQKEALAPVKLPALPANMTADQKLEEANKARDMGKKLLDSEMQEKAATWLGRAIALNPKDAQSYLMRSECESWSDKTAKALVSLNKAIDLKPDYAEAYTQRGHVFVAMNQHAKAIADFDKAFTLSKKETEAMGSKAKLEDESGKHKEAVADYTKIIEVDPQLSWPYVQRGIAYEALKDYNKAIADYTLLCDRYPKSYDYFELRGTAYMKANQLQKSLADYNKVVELNPKYSGGYANRAKIYQKIDGKQSPRVMADLKRSK